jgi:hypothetical protein
MPDRSKSKTKLQSKSKTMTAIELPLQDRQQGQRAIEYQDRKVGSKTGMMAGAAITKAVFIK